MKPVDFEGANVRLGQPEDWDEARDGPCSVLPAMRMPNGLVSFWKPSEDDLAALAAGGFIQLYVFGGGHPAVSIDIAPAANVCAKSAG